MSARTSLQETILAEGMEDLIPLPEIAATVRIRRLVAPEFAITELSSALISLPEEGLIQVWAGHWSQGPEVLDPAAQELLVVDEQYEFNSSSDLVRRVYYVNVENLKVNEEHV